MTFKRIDKIIMSITKSVSLISGILMVIIAVLATANVLTSKIGKWSIPGVNDWITYLFLGVVYCSIAFVRLDSGLIQVDILSNHYPPVLKNILGIISDLFGIGIFALIFWYGIPLFKENLRFKQMSSTAAGSFVLWPFNLIILIFSIMMIIAIIWSIIRVFVYGITKPQPGKEKPVIQEGGNII